MASEQEPITDPEELVEEWRSLASMAGMHQRETFNARCEIYAKCADELEEAINAE